MTRMYFVSRVKPQLFL